MPFKISKRLAKSLPDDEAGTPEEVGKQLLAKSGGVCSLCEGKMNLASEMLEADHEIPVVESGKNELGNLNLVHQRCNRAKGDRPTRQVRPYLKLNRFIREKGGRIKYDIAVEHFGINPAASRVTILPDEAHFEFPDSSTSTAAIQRESTDGVEFLYTFVSLPRRAIINDDEVQPRIIRANHAVAIYLDLLRNPLHEPPSCRLGPEGSDGLRPILMFDGQHKTVANWMLGRDSVVAKVYLNLDAERANILVNSIQAKIKKLPLSAFELAAKMSDEWQAKIDEYESHCRATGAIPSEKGFIDSIPKGQDRNRAKAAFRDALVQSVLDHPDLRMLGAVKVPGSKPDLPMMTETMLKSKVLKELLQDSPLDVPLTDSSEVRAQEVENIVWMLNQVHDGLVTPDEDGELSAVQLEARRRFLKQGALKHVSTLLRQLYIHHTLMGSPSAPLKGQPEGKIREQIEAGIENLVEHPVWTAAFDSNGPMLSVELALQKNQGVAEAFESGGMTLSYLVIGRADAAFKKVWK